MVYDVLDGRRDCKLKYALIRHTEDGALCALPAAQEGQPGDAGRGEMERIVKKLKKAHGLRAAGRARRPRAGGERAAARLRTTRWW